MFTFLFIQFISPAALVLCFLFFLFIPLLPDVFATEDLT